MLFLCSSCNTTAWESVGCLCSCVPGSLPGGVPLANPKTSHDVGCVVLYGLMGQSSECEAVAEALGTCCEKAKGWCASVGTAREFCGVWRSPLVGRAIFRL